MTLREGRRQIIALFGKEANIIRRSHVVAIQRHVVFMRLPEGKAYILAIGRTVDQAVEAARAKAGEDLLKAISEAPEAGDG